MFISHHLFIHYWSFEPDFCLIATIFTGLFYQSISASRVLRLFTRDFAFQSISVSRVRVCVRHIPRTGQSVSLAGVCAFVISRAPVNQCLSRACVRSSHPAHRSISVSSARACVRARSASRAATWPGSRAGADSDNQRAQWRSARTVVTNSRSDTHSEQW